MRKDAPLAVEVPRPDGDRPAWVKVGVIAAVGFVIGVAWPRVMGVKLGPSAPGEAAAAAASAKAASSGRASDAPPASVTAATTGAGAAPTTASASGSAAGSASAASGSGAPNISVQKGNVISCKGEDGDTKKGNKECGGVAGLDQLIAPRIRKLQTCAAAEGQTGKLSFMVTADFSGAGKLTWDVGKSSTIGNVDGVTGCLKTIFSGVGLVGVPHERSRYTVAYSATFAPGAKTLDDKGEDAKKGDDAKSEKNAKEDKTENADKAEAPAVANGEATIGWEVALVRDVPKTGGVVARLPRGTKVKLGTSKDGWYAVKYGDGFASDGWVYRGALGK